MNQSEHDAKMNELEERYLKRISELVEQISQQKYELTKYRTALAGLKWLMQEMQASGSFEP